MKRAKYHIMSQTVVVNTEPLKWPIAPDGYIPNSVIRSWRRNRKGLTTMDCVDDILFYSLHQRDECTTDDQEDVSTRVFWVAEEEDDEEEEEKTDDVKRRKKEKEVEKDKEQKTEVEVKEERKMDRPVLLTQPYNIQTNITVQNQLKTCDDVEPQTQEVSSTYSSRKAVNFL